MFHMHELLIDLQRYIYIRTCMYVKDIKNSSDDVVCKGLKSDRKQISINL